MSRQAPDVLRRSSDLGHAKRTFVVTALVIAAMLGVIVAVASDPLPAVFVLSGAVATAAAALAGGPWSASVTVAYMIGLGRASPQFAGYDSIFAQGLQFLPLLIAAAYVYFRARRDGVGGFPFFGGLASLVALTAFAIISFVWSWEPRETLLRGGAMVVVTIFLVMSAKFRWIDRTTITRDARLILLLITATGFAGLIAALSSPTAFGNFGRFQGLLPNPNYAAMLASIAICLSPWLLTRGRTHQTWIVAAALLNGVALVWSGSRGALVATVLGLCVCLLVSPWRRRGIAIGLPLLAVGTAAVGVFYVTVPTFAGLLNRSAQGADFLSGRGDIWAASIRLWWAHPVLGVGFGGVQQSESLQGFTTHNLVLTALTELGVVGGLLSVVLIWKLCSVGWRGVGSDKIYLAVPVGVVAGQMFESAAFGFGGPVALPLWIAVALGVSLATVSTRDSAPRATTAEGETPTTPRVSVCMATYNGAAFVQEQIESILAELGPLDELVIVDDASTDDTVAIIETIRDDRIRLIEASANRGHVATFESALAAARGEFLLLSDQDDVWVPGRVAVMIDALQRAQVVASDFAYLGDFKPVPPKVSLRAIDSGRNAANFVGLLLGKRAYFGCAMGVRRDALQVLLPFPRSVEAHDLWLAITGISYGSLRHIESATLWRRIHATNLTPTTRRPLQFIAWSRVLMVHLAFIAMARQTRAGAASLLVRRTPPRGVPR